MAELPDMINDLALILVSAGIVTIIFKRLKQPLVFEIRLELKLLKELE